MAFNGHFQDGFDDYGPTGYQPIIDGAPKPDGTALLLGEWTGIVYTGLSMTAQKVNAEVREALLGTGQSLRVQFDGGFAVSAGGISKTLEGSYEGLRFALVFRTELTTLRQGFVFADASVGQIGVTVETTGQIGVRQGGILGTLIAVSAASVSSFEANTLSGRVTFDGTTGSVKLWLNGQVILDRANLDTQATANATANQFQVWAQGSNDDLDGSWIEIDHLYVDGYLSEGDLEDPIDTLPMIETQFGEADYSVDFACGAALLGPDYSATRSTLAPGANQLVLRRYTPDADGDLDIVSILPAATSAGAKFRSAVYSDTAGAPNARLDAGGEVVGCIAGADLDLPLTSPVALSAGVAVWIGFITDTSVSLNMTDQDGLEGRKAANTYGSGVPNPAPAMTTPVASWVIYGQVSGVVDNLWSVVDQNPVSPTRSYLFSSGVGDKILLEFPNLSSTPTTIYGVQVKALVWRADSGARTVDLISKSGATTGSGDNAGQTPALTPSYISSFFGEDPDTSAAWNASGVNLSRHGIEIAS